jgi:hypothetical protein
MMMNMISELNVKNCSKKKSRRSLSYLWRSFKRRLNRTYKINLKNIKTIKTTKPPLQKILKGNLHTDNENNISRKGQEVLNLMGRIDKQSKSSTELAAHIQVFEQQKQLNGKNHHILLNINTEN